VPSKYDYDYTHQLEDLELLTTRPARFDFAAGIGMRLIVEAHAPGVFRLRCGPTARLGDDKPSARQRALVDMLLARDEAVGEATASPTESGDGWRITQGDWTVQLDRDPLRLTLKRGDEPVLCTMASEVAPAFGYCSLEDVDNATWRLNVALADGEPVYGLGETPGDINRRDEAVVSDDPQHRALPLAWSPRGWGIYVNTVSRVHHDIGTDDHPDAYLITIDDCILDVFMFGGEPAEILNQYSALTGRAGQPTLWAMGVWLTQAKSGSLADTLAMVERLRAEGIGLDAVALGAPSAWCFQTDKAVFDWDASRFADSRGVLARLRQAHVHVVAQTFPAVLAGTALFEELQDRGWLLTRDDGGGAHVFNGNEATGGRSYGLLDLTCRDPYNLWVERHRLLVEEGLGAPACNAQIAIANGVSARYGETGAVLRTIYPLLARRALFDAVAGHKVPSEGVVPSTDLFPAGQRVPWQVGPAVTNDWAGLQHTLRTALAIGASGLPVQTHLVGNPDASSDGMTAELWLRWLTMGVFSANLSFAGRPGLLPWAFGEATLALARTWIQWRYRLVPYVLGAVEDAARTGLPVQRSMALAFPADTRVYAWDAQYLLGPALLIAPMLASGETVQVYFPQGEAWWDLNTGYRYEGGTVWSMQCGLNQFPVFGREGHMLCLGPAAQHTGEFNSARILDEVWMFGMPVHNPVGMRNKIRVMQMQGSSYIKGLEGLRILPSEGLEVKRRGAEVRISRVR
jgi:alpha-glucosidase (family GH31 glycosyl hydrolase)